jgi:ATP-dependent DNA helicase Q1
VTLEAWQLLKITAAVQQDGGNLTLNMLAGLARGAGGGVYEVSHGGGGKKGKGKAKEKEKMTLDLDDVAGGVVDLAKDVGHSLGFIRIPLRLKHALGN